MVALGLILGGLVALAVGIVRSGPEGSGIPEDIPDDLAVHVVAPGATDAALESGTYWIVATGPGLVTTSADGPEIGLQGSDLVAPDLTLVGPDDEPLPIDETPASLLVQGAEGRDDAQGIAVVDVPDAGAHVLTVGEPTAPLAGIGLVALDAGDDDAGASGAFAFTFGGTAALILGVLLLVLRLR